MTIKIGEYTFTGLYTTTEQLEDRSGVYAIICQKDGKNYLVDIGESAEVKTRVENHDRKDCWVKNCQGNLAVAVYYTTNWLQSQRIALEKAIRKQFQVPCGKE